MARKGEHLSQETKRKISDALRGRKMDPVHKQKFREGTRRYIEHFIEVHGHHPSKGRRPVSEFKKGNTLWIGRHHTEESRRKISEALKERNQSIKESPETRARKSKSHMGKVPWNKGLTRAESPSLARVGEATRRRWTPEMRQRLRERNTKFWKDFWTKNPGAKAYLTQVSRPTSIELLARESFSKRGIPIVVSKRLEDLCYPDVILQELKIAVFCHGCFWHACPTHNPVVPAWLREKIKDQYVEDELRKRGWRILVVWEHEFKMNKDAAGLKLDAMLGPSASVS